jgi:leukotriene-A4 hydrolase
MTSPLDASKGQNLTLRLNFVTNQDGKAMSWLTESQTATKIMKYMFSQCEPIYCRSVAPLQDTPSIKSTY